MFWRSDKGKNKSAEEDDKIIIENAMPPAPAAKDEKASAPAHEQSNMKPQKEMSREELLASNPQARVMYEKLLNLRTSVDSMVTDNDAYNKAGAEFDARRDEILAARKKRREAEAQKIAAQKQAEIAKKQAIERQWAARQTELARIKAEEKEKIKIETERVQVKEKEAQAMRKVAQQANVKAGINFEEGAVKPSHQYRSLDEIVAQQARAKAEAVKEHVETVSEEIAQKQQHEKIKEEVAKAEAARDEALKILQEKKKAEKKARDEARAKAEKAARAKAEKQARIAEENLRKKKKAEEEARQKKARAEAMARLKAQKKAQEKALKKQRETESIMAKEKQREEQRKRWAEEEEKRQAARRRKLEERHKEQEASKAIQEEMRRYRKAKKLLDNKSKLEKIREEDASKGGGIVTIHGVEIKTELNKRENIKLWDLLGLKTKAERKAATEEERMALRLEREYRREDARAKYSFNRMLRLKTYENSSLGKAIKKFGNYCEEHKRSIITAAASVATILVALASGVNYCTGFEYSYNGTALGIVDNKNDALQVTELIAGALSEDNQMDVIISPNDIEFRRVSTLGGVKVDTTEDVLKRLTYMGDFKVASYGVYVDGIKLAAVSNKHEAAKVLTNLKDRYTSKYENTKVLDAVFLENVKVKKCTTKLENIKTPAETMAILTTDVDKQTVHKALTGDTVASIAKQYGASEQQIFDANEHLNGKEKIDAGTPVTIRTVAPPVTVKITEEVKYSEAIPFEVEKTNDKKMYRGDSKITQKGEKGERDVHAKITLVNGNAISEKIINEDIVKEPVTKKITVGTKRRPPTIGDGKFSNPIHDKYHLTTSFRMRWGRFHKGVDLACPTGTAVYAADGGTVIIASYKPSYGNLVVIDHKNGYTTKYAHNSKIVVKVGDKVYEGQKVAEVGSTGNSTGPHSHFEVRKNDVPQDPFKFIKP